MLHDISSLQNVGNSPLYAAAYSGHDAVVAVLLSHGADVNQANADGTRPIDQAKTQQIKDMIYAHMKKKYQESQQPVDESLWRTAAVMGDLAMIQQGINDKIDVNCRDIEGHSTALYLSSREGHLPCVEYLISQHSNLNITSVSAHDFYLSIYPHPLPLPILTPQTLILLLYVA